MGDWQLVRVWEMHPPNELTDPKVFLEFIRKHFHRKLVEELNELKNIKFQLCLKVDLWKEGPSGKEELTVPIF